MTEYFNSLANAINSLLGIPDQIDALIKKASQYAQEFAEQLGSLLHTAKLAYEILIVIVILSFFLILTIIARLKRMEKKLDEISESLPERE